MTDFYLGEIKAFGFNFAPRGWATCSGQILPIAQNTALFALLGTQYGGNGQTTFALPDLRGRAPVHRDGTNPVGTVAGTETVTLLSTEMPSHAHVLYGTSAAANKRPATGNTFATDNSPNADFYARGHVLVPLAPNAIGPAGGSQPHSNMQPYLAINYSIAITGIFPSRN